MQQGRKKKRGLKGGVGLEKKKGKRKKRDCNVEGRLKGAKRGKKKEKRRLKGRSRFGKKKGKRKKRVLNM